MCIRDSGKDLFLLVDVCNHSITYDVNGYTTVSYTHLLHHDLQTTAVVAGLVHSPVNVKLCLRNIQPAGKLAQLAESHLELTVVKHSIIPKIPVFSGSHHSKCRLVACLAAHPDASHVASHIAEGGLTHSSNPEAAPVMLAVLILSLIHILHKNVSVAELELDAASGSISDMGD